MSNVIKFPSKGNFVPDKKLDPSPEDVALNVSMVKYNHINEVLEMLMPMLIRNMELAGFHIVLPEDEEDKNIKDVALIVESLRSLMCKYYEIKHPFQDISEEIFQYNDDGSFALAKTLEMDFSEFEISIMEQPES